jgi:hypothetical protein
MPSFAYFENQPTLLNQVSMNKEQFTERNLFYGKHGATLLVQSCLKQSSNSSQLLNYVLDWAVHCSVPLESWVAAWVLIMVTLATPVSVQMALGNCEVGHLLMVVLEVSKKTSTIVRWRYELIGRESDNHKAALLNPSFLTFKQSWKIAEAWKELRTFRNWGQLNWRMKTRSGL